MSFAELEGTVAEMVVPIPGQARVEGLLYVDNRSPRPFTDHDEAVAARIGRTVATVAWKRLAEVAEVLRPAPALPPGAA